jgi:transcriptional regulator with XRE-family HTH domain
MNPFYSLGQRIYLLRTKEGWTQQELADRLNRTRYQPGVKQPHIAGLERSRGDKLPSVPLLAALSEVFSVSMQEIIGLDPLDKSTPNLLKGLRAEDRAFVVTLVYRLRQDNDDVDLDEEWKILSNTAVKELGSAEATSIGNRIGFPVQ